MPMPLFLVAYVPGIRRAPPWRPLPVPPPKVSRIRHLEPLTGQRFGRLVVVGYEGMCSSGSRWRCLCDCGGVKVVERGNLRQGRTRSCGCLWLEWAEQARAAAR